ncbi:hypothetical protein scyTo_0013478 [Scyliorhinus torazame]|uniref:Uncharacterized protein n=1 Tax=Scyliorhinus torazame TaxID=75743 RepID=A0A401NXK0_SCYTO|nr:hypothetical protein [Scyliorhinus torazame]
MFEEKLVRPESNVHLHQIVGGHIEETRAIKQDNQIVGSNCEPIISFIDKIKMFGDWLKGFVKFHLTALFGMFYQFQLETVKPEKCLNPTRRRRGEA